MFLIAYLKPFFNTSSCSFCAPNCPTQSKINKYKYKHGFKVHLKVVLAPANYYFLHQELCLFVCLQARKKVAQCTFKVVIFKIVIMSIHTIFILFTLLQQLIAFTLITYFVMQQFAVLVAGSAIPMPVLNVVPVHRGFRGKQSSS